MRLWHDDIRRPPACNICRGTGRREHNPIVSCPGCYGKGTPWLWARTNKEAIEMILLAEKAGDPVTEISMDHDLGEHEADPDDPESIYRRGLSPEGDGADLAQALCLLRMVPPKVTIHSWNSEGAARMASYFDAYAPLAEVRVQKYRPPEMTDEEYDFLCRAF